MAWLAAILCQIWVKLFYEKFSCDHFFRHICHLNKGTEHRIFDGISPKCKKAWNYDNKHECAISYCCAQKKFGTDRHVGGYFREVLVLEINQESVITILLYASCQFLDSSFSWFNSKTKLILNWSEYTKDSSKHLFNYSTSNTL